MSESHFDILERAIREDGPQAALGRLIEALKAERKLPQLFEACLMRKRHELGLPIQGTDSLDDLPEEFHQTVEDYYVETCRTVGSLYLEEGDIAGAWPYFRAIDEPEKVARALDSWAPPPAPEDPESAESADSAESAPGSGVNHRDTSTDTSVDTLIDIAFNQAVSPRRGYELILAHQGTGRAVTVFEHQFPFSGKVKEICAGLLVRQVHGEVLEALRKAVEEREGQPPEEADIRPLIEGRSWLFDAGGHPGELSHLQAAVRAAAVVRDSRDLELGIQMCEYGRLLPRNFYGVERSPFEDFYNDYRILLRALAGEGTDGAVRYFRAKADSAAPADDGSHFAGEVVVHLLHRVGRHGEAIEAYDKYLRAAPGPFALAPPLVELCERAGDFDSLLEISREKEDLLQYTIALVKRSAGGAGVESTD
jgi:hypothetical protein